VTCSHKGTTTISCLVDRTVVVLVFLDVFLYARLEPNHRALDEEDLCIRFVEDSLLIVPFTAFNKHTKNVDTIFRRRRVIFLDNFEVEDQLINCNLVFSGEVLNSTCQETLNKIKLINPVEGWDTIIDPILEEL